jgi:hypothetical protein
LISFCVTCGEEARRRHGWEALVAQACQLAHSQRHV